MCVRDIIYVFCAAIFTSSPDGVSVRVQGDGRGGDIVAALKLFNVTLVDVILWRAARGSIEDSGIQREIVARAIVDGTIP